MAQKERIFYFHIPKTSGSSLNRYLTEVFGTDRSLCHIQGLPTLCPQQLDRYDFVSGHMTYTKMRVLLDLENWLTVATFREPYAHVISHLCWLRKLSDPGEEKLFRETSAIFQNLSREMTQYDFSRPSEITRFICAMEASGFSYFHNCQTLYLDESCKSLETALKNLEHIDVVGLAEDLPGLIAIIARRLNLDLPRSPSRRENVNPFKYGFRGNDPGTREALFPLVERDLVIYHEARARFQRDCHRQS